ncbi:hypothetical protein H0H87_006007 [Tephrocybe sp. NHM501043]|nr:hypothetical protein H0H87_006007 [Tephrocybe sp. NHM501043]
MSLVKNVDNCLDALKQTGSAHLYLTSFIDIASHLDMIEETKIFHFIKRLKPAMKNSLVPIVDQPKTLDAWESIIISIDNNLHQHELKHHQENKASSSNKKKDSNPSTQSSYPTNILTFKLSVPAQTTPNNAMDIDTITTGSSTPCEPISKAEHKHCIKNDLCLYCSGAGHKVNKCLKCKYAQEQGKALKSKTA